MSNSVNPWRKLAAFALAIWGAAWVMVIPVGATIPPQVRYYFNFYYNNGSGDYYSGYVIHLAMDNKYQVGDIVTVAADENGQPGYYEITSISSGGSSNVMGLVYVTSYVDVESGKTYTPVSNGNQVGLGGLGSEHDYIIKKDVPEFFFGDEFYEADVGDYSLYNFNFYYNNGSGDYYVGYVFAPTSFQSGDFPFAVSAKLYNQPETFWDWGYQSLGGACYELTAITDGFAASYDKQSYITAYYDADTAKTRLGVNSSASATAASIYVADRTAAWEQGYAISGANHSNFSPYIEADVTLMASSPAVVGAAPAPTALPAGTPGSQVVWGGYWDWRAGGPEEDDYR